ncbi:septum formation initiator family protein [Kocuria flava]|uniref:FtsB family cell division protein n=1 Tax=Kocuria flava TaxID=446860 RepID=UPI001FF64193|nr:septum formation initiator family protein [Kocuria flava]MCJ8504509.1 septum formation initiator family protein [Kocuria flava]
MPAPRSRSARPAGGREPARGGRGTRPQTGSSAVGEPEPARSFSGRFLVLTLVAVLIVFLAAPTTKIWLEQRAEIAALEESIAEMRAREDSLEQQVDQWSDETYVRQQARDRLLYVMPGERSYLVVGAEQMEGAVVDSSAAQVEAERPAWVDALWQSVVAAAHVDEAGGAPEDGAAGDGSPGQDGTAGDDDGTTTGPDPAQEADPAPADPAGDAEPAEDPGPAAEDDPAGIPDPASPPDPAENDGTQ